MERVFIRFVSIIDWGRERERVRAQENERERERVVMFILLRNIYQWKRIFFISMFIRKRFFEFFISFFHIYSSLSIFKLINKLGSMSFFFIKFFWKLDGTPLQNHMKEVIIIRNTGEVFHEVRRWYFICFR